MAEDRTKIILKKNQDGTTKKVLVKKVIKKVKLKTTKSKEKPEEKKDKTLKMGTGTTDTRPSTTNKESANKTKRPEDNRRPNRDRPRDDNKKKIFIKRGGTSSRTGGDTDKNLTSEDKRKIAEKRRQKHKDRNRYHDKDKFEKELTLHKRDKEKDRLANIPSTIEIMGTLPIKEFAKKLNIKASDIIKKLMNMGLMATINDTIDSESAAIVASEYKCEVKVISLYDQTVVEEEKGKEKDYIARDPIVTVMGHVDHGKTQLLDAIRKTNVISTESGGITQHIGAYKVKFKKGGITFLDTPGHEAFTSMRARGAKVTDIVILVVAADDGVMPQTIEAINHAKEAKVPIIVAINKMDKPDANPEKVKKELSEHGLLPEDWSGDTIMIPISALKGTNIDELLEHIALQAEMLELKANPKVKSMGTVIEAKIEQGRGTVITVIVQNGTLKKGAPFVSGVYTGRVRAMFDDKGNNITEAGPSTPVEIIGIDGVPNSGDPFHVLNSEKEARSLAQKRQELLKQESAKNVKKVTLNNLFETIKQGNVEEFKVIVKGDVFGSVEAIKEYLNKLENDEVRVNVIQANTGAINERDVLLASTSNAIVIGFKVRPNAKAKKIAEQEKVDVKIYNIIYDIIDDMKQALQGMLKPVEKEEITGLAEVREVFRITKVGSIAGCYVNEGAIQRSNLVRVLRDNVVVYTGELSSLKRFKDDAKEVKQGFECGISIDKYNDIKEGDILECYKITHEEKKLELNLKKEEDNAGTKSATDTPN